MTQYVLISGKKQHGKNHLANMLVAGLQLKNKTAKVVAFADPIKNFVSEVFGIPREDMETEEGKNKPTHVQWRDIERDIGAEFHKYVPDKLCEYITVRQMLQLIGTDLFRKRFYDPIWAEAPFRKKHLVIKSNLVDYDNGDWDYVDTHEEADVVIIADCRFPNELETGKKYGAHVVRVVRPGQPSDDTHASETALDDHKWAEDEIFLNNEEGNAKAVTYITDVLLPKLGL